MMLLFRRQFSVLDTLAMLLSVIQKADLLRHRHKAKKLSFGSAGCLPKSKSYLLLIEIN